MLAMCEEVGSTPHINASNLKTDICVCCDSFGRSHSPGMLYLKSEVEGKKCQNRKSELETIVFLRTEPQISQKEKEREKEVGGWVEEREKEVDGRKTVLFVVFG